MITLGELFGVLPPKTIESSVFLGRVPADSELVLVSFRERMDHFHASRVAPQFVRQIKKPTYTDILFGCARHVLGRRVRLAINSVSISTKFFSCAGIPDQKVGRMCQLDTHQSSVSVP